MRQVDIDLENTPSMSALYERLRKEGLHPGDHLRVHITRTDNTLVLSVFMFVLLLVFMRLFSKAGKPGEPDLAQRVQDDLFGRYSDLGEFERDLEAEFGVRISLLMREPEDRAWMDLTLDQMGKAYGTDEPDYALSDVREPNPRYGRTEE